MKICILHNLEREEVNQLIPSYLLGPSGLILALNDFIKSPWHFNLHDYKLVGFIAREAGMSSINNLSSFKMYLPKGHKLPVFIITLKGKRPWASKLLHTRLAKLMFRKDYRVVELFFIEKDDDAIQTIIGQVVQINL